jgi:hypothetical protein
VMSQMGLGCVETKQSGAGRGRPSLRLLMFPRQIVR